MVVQGNRLTGAQVASRIGVKPDTWWSYLTRARQERARGNDRYNLAPEPDGYEDVSGSPWWFESTIDEWNRLRPGQGGRTDRYAAGWRPVA